jgi:hypothetical protein
MLRHLQISFPYTTLPHVREFDASAAELSDHKLLPDLLTAKFRFTVASSSARQRLRKPSSGCASAFELSSTFDVPRCCRHKTTCTAIVPALPFACPPRYSDLHTQIVQAQSSARISINTLHHHTPRSLHVLRRHTTFPRLHDGRQAGEEKVLR